MPSSGRGDLPAYTVRRSIRARHVRLVVDAREGLIVVVPERWDGDPAAVVEAKRDWVRAHLMRVADRVEAHSRPACERLPEHVELTAVAKRLPVSYIEAADPRTCARERDGALVVRGDVSDAERALAALRRWADRTARQVLASMLADVAAEHGLSHGGVRVRPMRSRWGSCSPDGRIALSRSLLFVPPHLARSVILHELVHLAVPDHSSRFWSKLLEIDPDALEHRAQLRDAALLVPVWADA